MFSCLPNKCICQATAKETVDIIRLESPVLHRTSTGSRSTLVEQKLRYINHLHGGTMFYKFISSSRTKAILSPCVHGPTTLAASLVPDCTHCTPHVCAFICILIRKNHAVHLRRSFQQNRAVHLRRSFQQNLYVTLFVLCRNSNSCS